MELKDSVFYNLADAKAKFSQVVDQTKDKDVIITKNGVPISVMINYNKFIHLMEFIDEIRDISLFDLEDVEKFKDIKAFFKNFDA
ncbi:type II toxin-antitoxin system prevent-host-death family antitoxin [Petrotoga sp. 9PWA.NaAc.5.4]|uniref:type II toxin-antitoxin system prevent-host-death family antitoxin n=1 Tax=Petrotoga sp. 9PWA.NaAc.5.4 TaxID=1434328 RepID=UPI000CAD6415|nr:type II toxin-antitoxin system prevent-host-death family antitoxin [Petrotoga sp. 9PWA.NaAc.5.4]PNR92808.1 prevent-host-death protein [Petrotoga sp. 9PWA.NaAc.5.4]